MPTHFLPSVPGGRGPEEASASAGSVQLAGVVVVGLVGLGLSGVPLALLRSSQSASLQRDLEQDP